jgi:ABC-type uncharacterized transport system permease subunit
MMLKTWMQSFAVAATSLAVVALTGAAPLAQSAPAKAPAQAQPAPKPAAASVKLPAAVENAFKTAYPQATIKHTSHETEDGVEQYEIESTNQGRALDVNYKPDGTVIVVEEEVTASELPAAVATAVTTRYPKATVTTRERATEGQKVYFELGLKGAPVKEVQLTPDGKWISPKPAK